MKLLKNIEVPTGNILIGRGEKGDVEFLSLGDYGKSNNVKADFLGLKEDINGVEDGELMPLEEKWVITISTQHGCSMGCNFCDVPKVGRGRNVTLNDLTEQIVTTLKLHPEVLATKRLNVHYARMGEPTFNPNVLEHARGLMKEVRPYINRSHIHPVISTMLPRKNKNLMHFLQEWCEIKNYNYRGSAGLQFSINSTSDEDRNLSFNGSSLSLSEISKIGQDLPDPVGRKYALNIALSDNAEINAEKMLMLFSPNKFMIKITPMHVTSSTTKNSIKTTNGYSNYTPYQCVERRLKAVGFDVLVFIPSLEEDQGRITCGNAILSGTKPLCAYKVLT